MEKMLLVRMTFEKPVEGEFYEDGVYHIRRGAVDHAPVVYIYKISDFITTTLRNEQCNRSMTRQDRRLALKAFEDSSIQIYPNPRINDFGIVANLRGVTTIETVEAMRNVRQKPTDPFCMEFITKTVTVERTNPGTYVDLEITYDSEHLDVKRLFDQIEQKQQVWPRQTFVIEVIKDGTEIMNIDKEIAELQSKIHELERRKAALLE